VTPATDPGQFFNDVAKMLDALKTGPLPLDRFILPANDMYLKAELARRQEARAEHDRRVAEGEIQKESCD